MGTPADSSLRVARSQPATLRGLLHALFFLSLISMDIATRLCRCAHPM
jgi:hypothetical protein